MEKKFTVKNRHDYAKNMAAIQKVIARYEKKTGRVAEIYCTGNAFFRFEAFAWTKKKINA